MLSSVSGKYFAGHLAKVTPVPPSAIYYNMALGSYPGTGNTINDLSGNGWNITNVGPTTISYNSTAPRSIQYQPAESYAETATMPLGVNNISTTRYQTVSFWYRQTAAIPGTSVLLNFNDTRGTFDGIYMGAGINGILRVTTNGPLIDNVQELPANTTTFNVWQMITFKYILSATLPCVIYINANPVFSYYHGNDLADEYTPRLLLQMSSIYARWNDFILVNDEYTDAMVLARYTATRTYYGV